MKLKVCNTGSDGNTYLLNNDKNCIVLDCGVQLKTVKKTLDYKVNHIKFALCTHIHGDHMAYVKEYFDMGIKVLMPKQVKALFIDNMYAIEVQPMKKNIIGEFYVTAFEVPHDSNVTCYAYIIEHSSFGKLLYMTDCMYCKYDLKKLNLNHILCECNYMKSLVDENYEKNLRDRVLRTHMELETVKEFIKANKSNALQTVILCHLSRENANPKEMLVEVKKVANCEVYVAEKGIEVELKNGNECPF